MSVIGTDLLTRDQAAALLPHNPPVSRTTWWRWSSHGLRGKRLRIHRIGGRVFVKRTALEEFVRAVTAEHGERDPLRNRVTS